MRALGGAGEAGWLPAGWPAGENSSSTAEQKSIFWRRLLFGKNPTRTLRRVLCWATGSLVFFHYLLVPIKVIGASMTPTYRDGSVNFVNRLSYKTAMPKRGDVIVLRDEDNQLILKRVIAVPGERVALHYGIFYINGKPLQDRFSNQPVNWDFAPTLLRADEYFVIGDNRTYSIFGKYNRSQILGKIFF
jgi:signal peptidase I